MNAERGSKSFQFIVPQSSLIVSFDVRQQKFFGDGYWRAARKIITQAVTQNVQLQARNGERLRLFDLGNVVVGDTRTVNDGHSSMTMNFERAVVGDDDGSILINPDTELARVV